MTIRASEQQIAAATAYQDLHVPALFGQWASRVAEAADIPPSRRILDVACGTGVLAREAASRLGEDGLVVGLDASPGMLAVAERLAPWIEWRQGAAERLPFGTGAFDAVISQFGLMFFSDRLAALGEMLRVLVPGGRIAVAVWGPLADCEAYAMEAALLERLAGRQAADAVKAPFVLGDRAQLAALFKHAGVKDIGIATHSGRAQFPGLRTMVEADLRGWLPVMGVDLTEQQIENILQEGEQALQQFVTPEGRVMFNCPAHIVTGRKL